MIRKIPMRKCLATNQVLPKKELLRIVRTPENEIKVDLSGKVNGKGAYIKKDVEALKVLKSKRLLQKALGVEVSDDVYEEILKVINE